MPTDRRTIRTALLAAIIVLLIGLFQSAIAGTTKEAQSGKEVNATELADHGLPEFYDGLPRELQLLSAAAVGWKEKVQALLDQGMSVNTAFSKRTVLRAAIGGSTPWGDGGHPEVVKLLLARGADPNLRVEDGDPLQNPLYYAMFYYGTTQDSDSEKVDRYKQIIETLLDFGARMTDEWRDSDYRHPLLYVGDHCDISLIKRLLVSDLDLSRTGSDSIPLFACRDTRIVRLLLDHGAVITPGFVKWTLGGVNKPWKAEIAHWLLDEGVDPKKYRFVRFALAWSDYELLERALRSGASPDEFGKQNINVPLVYAALGNDERAVKLLLDYGADVDVTWRDKTAAEWAREDGYEEIAQLIENYSHRKGE